jgi:hypothetical protein
MRKSKGIMLLLKLVVRVLLLQQQLVLLARRIRRGQGTARAGRLLEVPDCRPNGIRVFAESSGQCGCGVEAYKSDQFWDGYQELAVFELVPWCKLFEIVATDEGVRCVCLERFDDDASFVRRVEVGVLGGDGDPGVVGDSWWFIWVHGDGSSGESGGQAREVDFGGG